MTRTVERADSDAGVTLIELIMYVLVLSIVLGAVTMILIGAWRTQEDVLSETEATNRGQLVSSAIERAVRNGLAIQVSGGNTLQVHTSLPGARACQGIDLSGGVARLKISSGALGTGWPAWQDGVTQIPGQPLLTASGSTVTYAFQLNTSTAPVRFMGTVSARNPTGVTSPCW